ncbi:hypothetical protein SAMN05428954_6369 [Streptomyces sp. 2112.3]|nr:hypothetical protein SAMN05428954_6369 [Streptomyces sp. 2112.3]
MDPPTDFLNGPTTGIGRRMGTKESDMTLTTVHAMTSEPPPRGPEPVPSDPHPVPHEPGPAEPDPEEPGPGEPPGAEPGEHPAPEPPD